MSIPARWQLDEAQRSALATALDDAINGDVAFDQATRGVYATDSSNYRQVPLGVVFPRDEDDVVAAMRVCADYDVAVTARGAGTSLAGQACNVGVIFDSSRYMTRIIEVNPSARTARVEPGVILDDLRRVAGQHGLTFGPDPATHAWCTLGGMVGNNACGTHGLYTGKTVDNVERMRAVMYGGDVLDVGAYSDSDYASAVARGGPQAQVLGGLRELGCRSATLVRDRFPDIPRRVSGYNLDQIVPDNPLHVARALVGTESTCVFVTEITVRLSDSPAHREMIVVGYPDVFAAADAVPSLLEFPLLGLEGFDDKLVDQMRQRPLHLEHLELLPPGGGWLIAELGADSVQEAAARAHDFLNALPPELPYRRYADEMSQRRVWLMRESGLGATAHTGSGEHNSEGWEDAAVAPHRLGEYLRAITALWDQYGYDGAWYGHFGQGCVHTRNNFDFSNEAGVAQYRSFIERAADLVVSLGGSLSGEHGDGQARGELLERMYGPDLVEAFRQFKAIFDPRGKMNPGKIVDPYRLDADLRYGPEYRRTPGLQPTFFSFREDAGSLQLAAERCVGVGRCRREDTGTMCPSYRATRDERHSTRGRAKLLVEMFQGEVTPARWRNEDVHRALDLGLSCKGCAVDCPTHVDMATYKAEFMAHYYRRRVRPRVMYALGLIPWTARAATRIPGVANSLLRSSAGSWTLRRLGGVARQRALPLFAAEPLRRSPQARARADVRNATVVVWPDTFTDAYRPEAAKELIAALEGVGERVAVPTAWACCARPLYDTGMLALARRALLQLCEILGPYIAAELPVVVIEPSCLAAMRDELPKLLPNDARALNLARLARSPAEHALLSPAFADVLRVSAPRGSLGRAVVHPHCHHRAVNSTDADRKVLAALGYEAEILDAGCCGLAGSFGFNAAHEELAQKIGQEQWLPKVNNALQATPTEDVNPVLVVDGFSCLKQLEHLGGAMPASMPTLLQRAVFSSAKNRQGAIQ